GGRLCLPTIWLRAAARGRTAAVEAAMPARRPRCPSPETATRGQAGIFRTAKADSMTRYIVKRGMLMFPTLLGVAVLVFVLLRVLPGDVVEMRFVSGQNQFVDQKMLDAERANLGLDRPIWQQFVAYLTGLLRLDLGRSMWTGSPITEEIKL